MKKIIEKILLKSLERLMDILLNGLEKMLNTDIDGDGLIGGEKPVKNEEK